MNFLKVIIELIIINSIINDFTMSDTLQNIVNSIIEQLQTDNEYVWIIPANATALLTTRVTNELEKRGFKVLRTINDTLTISRS